MGKLELEFELEKKPATAESARRVAAATKWKKIEEVKFPAGDPAGNNFPGKF